MSLSVKYRPQSFNDVVGQQSTIKILKKQLQTGNIKNSYLFCGASGSGKTTLARLLAKELNGVDNSAIELDAARASSEGKDTINTIVDQANERSISYNYKTFIIDECVTGDTEVLTENGWCRFDELSHNEKIAQYTLDQNIEFVYPQEYIEKDYVGPMYNIKIGNKVEFTMSPNHVQPLYYTKSNKIKESYIKDIKFAQSNKFIRSGYGVGDQEHLNAYDRLVIALQADGCLQNVRSEYNYWTIQVKKNIKKERLLLLLNESSVEYKVLASNRPNIVRYSVKTQKNVTKKLSTYFNLSSMSGTYAAEFIEELMIWDGYKNKKYYYYSCIDKDNTDFCQCVATIGGFKSRITIQNDSRKATHKTSYRLFLEKSFWGTTNQSKYTIKEQVDFCGKIYCVKVPSHMIIIRKNGFEMVTGNCHLLSKAAWNALLKTLEEPPRYTIFIFCTTEPNKVPDTIQNRCQRFNITKIPSILINERLKYICCQEGFTNYEDTCDYISKNCKNQLRDAISILEQTADISTELSLDNAIEVVGSSNYDLMFDIINAIIDRDFNNISLKLNELFLNSINIKTIVESLLKLELDINKYIIFNDISLTSVPIYFEDKIKNCINFDNPTQYHSYILNNLLELSINKDLNESIVTAYIFRMAGY